MSTSRGQAIVRGLTKRCERCGSGGLFQHYFTMKPECPRCGLHFEREQGYWAGALAINFICSGGLIMIVGILLTVLTLPHLNVALLLGVLVPVAILGPAVWYPHSKTLWVAIDRAFLQQMDQDERPDD